MNDEQFAQMIEKIDAMARLLALSALTARNTFADKAVALSEAGFRPKDIGWLLGKDPQRINEVLYQRRKRRAGLGDKQEATQDG